MSGTTTIGRRGLLAAAAGTAALALPRPALSQGQWPAGRPIEVIVGFAPGGGTDVMMRALALRQRRTRQRQCGRAGGRREQAAAPYGGLLPHLRHSFFAVVGLSRP